MKWGRDRRRARKRTNWLLIKHRDEYAHEGDDDTLLQDNETSVASGRTLKEIAIGAGKAPTPFMTAKKRAAGAVWQSNKKGGGKTAVAPESEGQAEEGPAHAGVHRAAARQAGRAAAVGAGLGARGEVRRLSPAAARRATARPRSSTRKGLDWTEKFQAIADVAEQLPDCMIDGEAVRARRERRAGFRGPAGGAVRGQLEDLIFFAFDLMFADGEDLRALPLMRAQGAAAGAAVAGLKDKQPSRSATSSISRRRATRCWHRPAAWASKASSPRSCDAPYRIGRAPAAG